MSVFPLLAGRFGAAEWKQRMDEWRMFQPIVLASYGVAQSFDREPATLLIDGIEPSTTGGRRAARSISTRRLAARHIVACVDRYLPGMKADVQVMDLATPLTFWRSARAWRGC